MDESQKETLSVIGSLMGYAVKVIAMIALIWMAISMLKWFWNHALV